MLPYPYLTVCTVVVQTYYGTSTMLLAASQDPDKTYGLAAKINRAIQQQDYKEITALIRGNEIAWGETLSPLVMGAQVNSVHII